MLESLVVGLTLVAISGLTILAYKHHEAYTKIVWPVIYILNGASALTSIIGGTAEITYIRLGRFIIPEKVAEAKEAVSSLELPYVKIWLAVFIFSGYLFFLDVILPYLVKKNVDYRSPENPSSDSKD